MFFFEANVKDALKPWPRVERYQNSTLRFTPGEDFPGHLEKMIGRPKIMRTFITLNDAWDFRNDEYHYDYVIGKDIYADDPLVDGYDRDESKLSPYGLTFLQYLKSHAAHADYLMFSVRRYEREVIDGWLSIDKYEEVLEHLLEYYKEIVPNLRYVEGNETNYVQFGNISAFETYELYKRMYRIVNRLNKKHNYEIPLEVGGPTYADSKTKFWQYEHFMRLYLLDRDPEKRLDFYATHEYTTDMTFLPELYRKHKALVKRMGLPEVPMMFNEYGVTDGCTPDPQYNQLNAAGSIEIMIALSPYDDFIVFPWCSYHDPSIQVDRTQYIDFNRTCGYLPTFLGQAYIALSKLLDDSIPLTGNIGNRAVLTTDGTNYALLATNRDDKMHNLRFSLTNLDCSKVKVDVYQVDAMHNNCFIDKTVDNLQCTDSFEYDVTDGKLKISDTLDARGFTLWMIQPVNAE